MKRYAMQMLKKWKEDSRRKPLIICGARQVGKTWLMKEFGSTSFSNIAYINFENNLRMQELFNGDYNIERLISALEIESDISITREDTLIIFDEIQEVPKALTSLKYFNENAPEYAIIAAGSLLGIGMRHGTSFPVGKVDFLNLHPMSFTEFLDATGNEKIHKLIVKHKWDLIKSFKSKYIDLLKSYLFVGGMPEAVNCFAEEHNYDSVRKIQERLLFAYNQDFSKHAPLSALPRIKMVWDSIPSQLAKDNRKFIYGSLRKGARAKDFEFAIQWLHDYGLIYQVKHISKPGIPLSAYAGNGFKMYMLDVGLLTALSGLDARSILEGNRVFEEFKGSLTEQYVLQELRTNSGLDPYYWMNEKGNGEVDFVFQKSTKIIPLEVKAAENLQAKSLKSYCTKYSSKIAIRTSMSDYRQEKILINIPLFCISEIMNLI